LGGASNNEPVLNSDGSATWKWFKCTPKEYFDGFNSVMINNHIRYVKILHRPATALNQMKKEYVKMKKYFLFVFLCIVCHVLMADINNEILLIRHAETIYAYNSATRQIEPLFDKVAAFSVSSTGTFILKKDGEELCLGKLTNINGTTSAQNISALPKISTVPGDNVLISPDGSIFIIYRYDKAKDTSFLSLYRVDVGGRAQKEYMTELRDSLECPSISPDNNKIVFYSRTNYDKECSLFLFCRDTKKIEQISPVSKPTTVSGPGPVQSPEWSASGKYVIFNGRFVNDFGNYFSVIRMSDKRILASPGAFWFNNDIIGFSFNKEIVHEFSSVNCDDLFSGRIEEKKQGSIFLGKNTIIFFFVKTINMPGVYLLQDTEKNYYRYQLNNNELQKLFKADFYEQELYLLKI